MQLNHLKRLNPRTAWQNEATDFTPWLAREENFSALADALHLFEAEVETTEHSIGSFSADILARDRDGRVLVENQLEQTDHTHLGQIITYVAGLEEPTKVVWISTRIREEHRAAIDWLNEQTGEDYSFFAVELELVQIEKSPAAPLFHVVAKPNHWSRHVARKSKNINNAALSERQGKYLEYWTAFAAALDEKLPGLRGSNPPSNHWWPFPIGRSGFHITLTAGGRDRWVGAEVYIQNDPEQKVIDALMQNKSAIETDYRADLRWERLEERKGSRVAVRWENIDPFDRNQWPEIFDWYIDSMESFRRAFAERIRKLDLEALSGSD
ncbi:DUF4268 domain-containing protein [uncultured Roseobacter sp.]|uniref:DUF4268 domain-containing protein n=1 Tax=uncultured Roseobacter sp. TaxID=114847 RepID=UPI00260F0987|nr:DUF4268 domain-containing protein [uncultured Roseobacter sp.]